MNINNDFISYQNQTILANRARALWETAKLSSNTVQNNVGFWSSIAAYLPFTNSQDVGRFIGFAVGQTHGADLSNATVQLAIKHLFPKEEEKPKSWRQTILNKIQGVSEPVIEEVAELVITPKVLPFVQMFLVNTGGLAVPAAVMLISSIYQHCLGPNQQKVTLDKMPSRESLMKVDKENQNIYTASGRELTEIGMRDTVKNVQEYDLICKLLKVKDVAEINKVVENYFILREDFVLVYKNGKAVTNEELHYIDKGIKRFADENIYSKTKSILRMLKLLRNNSPEVTQTLPILNGTIVKCEDGTYCDQEGKILSSEEVQVKLERDRAAREDLNGLNMGEWEIIEKRV